MKILPKASPADWRCPCCRMAVPKGEMEKAAKTAWHRSREAHRRHAHPDIERSEYAKLCRKAGVCAAGNAMRHRAMALNKHQARRQAGGSTSSASGPFSRFVCFTWPMLRRGKKVRPALELRTAWRCRFCPVVYVDNKQARLHKCGQTARLKGNKGRVKKLEKLRKRAPKLCHGIDADLLERTFATALRMLSGEDVDP